MIACVLLKYGNTICKIFIHYLFCDNHSMLPFKRKRGSYKYNCILLGWLCLLHLNYIQLWKRKKKRKRKIVFQVQISTLLLLSIIQIWDFIFEQNTEGSQYCFPCWLHQYTFPPTVYKNSLFSISGIFLDNSHPDRCEVKSYFGCN